MSISIRKFSFVFFAAALMAVLSLKTLDAGAKDYPDLNTKPLVPDSALEIAAVLQNPPGNIAVSKEGRVFFTLHPEGRPEGSKLFELKNGRGVPYPDENFQKNLTTPLGLATDHENHLWLIDHGANGKKNPRLFALDLASGKLILDYSFPREAAPEGSYLNDLRVSPDGKTVYIADIGFLRKKPAIVIYDAGQHTARRVLENHPSVKPQSWVVHSKLRKLTFLFGLIKLRLGVDGIALDDQGEWLYYAPMNHDSVFRIKTADLRNPALSEEALSSLVERYGPKPLSDGIEMGMEGNLYLTDVEHGTIFQLGPDRRLQTLITSGQIRWPDGMSSGENGFLYFTDSVLPELILHTHRHIKQQAPFYIYRIKLPVSKNV